MADSSKNSSLVLRHCKYGKQCYRKNKSHFKEFFHVEKTGEQNDASCDAPSEPLSKKRKVTTSPENDGKESYTQENSKHDFIKEKFGINMPQDFYDLWELCKEWNPHKPQVVHFRCTQGVNLELVGPYDVLMDRKFKTRDENEGLCLHYRYFYDPPEFVTVLKGDDSLGFHIGYYCDHPGDKPVLLASNEAKKSYEFKVLGDNIFAAISNSIKTASKARGKKKAADIQAKIKFKAQERNLNLDKNTLPMKARNSKVVAKTFHKMGIVVPVDDMGVGYRDLQISNAELKSMLTNIVDGNRRESLLDELQDIITRIQFANDECDYGMGLELGLDLFLFGHELFERKASMLLTLAYELLGKSFFGNCAKSTSKNATKVHCI
ncbi:histone PARylation factor 1-like [Xenia sp. Carnegie-2017]|uniref:histone PARylation factor 1-like n=1 Tax=Xenia sp. Carnegie-2017 TaxID=2897299 RepID=UPI001F044B20|nr:histone PARylation factor 1-like [Xenia sp. Carnegie-2017]